MIYIAMDDTDMPGTRGTGHLARQIAGELVEDGLCSIRGVSRHQLLRDPRVPMTKNNSCNVIHVTHSPLAIAQLAELVEDAMRREFIEGSDPGLCIVSDSDAASLTAFGRRAKQGLVTQAEALAAAESAGAFAKILGGTGDGIIGCTSGAGLAAAGDDGRFVQFGGVRDLSGTVTIAAILDAGICEVRTLDGETVTEGLVPNADKIRPETIGHRAVLLVQAAGEGEWEHVRRD